MRTITILRGFYLLGSWFRQLGLILQKNAMIPKNDLEVKVKFITAICTVSIDN
jgi:hypothetical protein